jgi:hypothetical protein
LIVGIFVEGVMRRVPKWPVKLILVAFVLALPLKAGIDNIGRFNRSDKNSQAQARAWVEQHVSKGAPICTAGWFTNGPRLVDVDPSRQGTTNDYFMYRRAYNNRYIQGYFAAHQRYIQSGQPFFDIANWGRKSLASSGDQSQFVDFCRNHKSTFVIVSDDKANDLGLAKVAQFGSIRIFEMDPGRG